jgi:hypothetical protein
VCARTLYIDDAMLSLTRARGILYSSLRDFFLFFFENSSPPLQRKRDSLGFASRISRISLFSLHLATQKTHKTKVKIKSNHVRRCLLRESRRSDDANEIHAIEESCREAGASVER